MASQELNKNEITKSRVYVINPEYSHKITPFQNNNYEELNQFRQQLTESLQGPHQPYVKFKKNANFYRMIFGFLGMLFVGLTTVVAMNKASWICALYFGGCYATKSSLFTFCSFLSLAVFGMCFGIRAEKEAVNQLYH